VVFLKASGGSTGWTSPCPPSGLSSDASLADAFPRVQQSASAEGRLTGLVTHAG